MTHTHSPSAPPPNVHPTAPSLTRAERFGLLGVSGATVWLTGLSGSGKSTIAAALERELVLRRVPAYRLDGDDLRAGLNADLGFSPDDRARNVRRIAHVARLLADSGAVAIVGAISPFRADRDAARALHESDPAGPLPFLEVFVDAPIGVCEGRDPKGLYRKARAGAIPGFTGIDSPYEPPATPELALRTDRLAVTEAVRACIDLLRRHAVVPAADPWP